MHEFAIYSIITQR